jgi:hypothetical protein
MEKLNLLFTKDGIFYQIVRNKNIQEEASFFLNEETPDQTVGAKLDELLERKFSEINVVSALNHFTLMPEGFEHHELGYDLIAYNALLEKEEEELMLSINKKFKVQFYYTFPKDFYSKIKNSGTSAGFNFSGEKFLNSISSKGGKEIHINLYHNQCEFFALDGRKIILYNNLDVNSEVDFLYFIMFSLSKIAFGLSETRFFVYGETSENDTFISELQKFVKNLKIVYDNLPKKKFLVNS